MQYLRILNPQFVKLWSCLHLQMIQEKGRTCFNVPVCIGVIWGRGCRGEGKMPLKNVSTKEHFFLLATEMKRGQIKKLVESGVQGFVHIKDWFKPMFPLLLT